MKKIGFNIKYRNQIEQGRYRLETRCGLPARIVCWDANGDFPLVVLVDYGDDNDLHEIAYNYSLYGTVSGVKQELDLIIITDEPELTVFEAKLKEIVDSFSNDIKMSDVSARIYANKLLNCLNVKNEEVKEAKDKSYFNPILHILDCAWPALSYTEKVEFIAYCEGLMDVLSAQGYQADAKLIAERISWMKGESELKVAIREKHVE